MSGDNDAVRRFWEAEPCGTAPSIVGDAAPGTPAWFERIEAHRYAVEPFIHAAAQFTRARGRRVLEVGVGAGTDHVQWARAGATCVGVDLTDAALRVTRARLAHEGHQVRLARAEGERLPFADGAFDHVWSWGVIHHAASPPAVVAELRRVLRPGGTFSGMIYHRRSLYAWRRWLRGALLAGRPLRPLADVIAEDVESPGTRAYTRDESRALFAPFGTVELEPCLSPNDVARLPERLRRLVPQELGFFLVVRARA